MAAVRDIPAHLRELVVSQAYDEYTEEDQAVWRFVVQHTRRRLLGTAHAAYRIGFEAAGISTDRIPRIAEMSEKLGAIGWAAVCVDGFIPPRAFQDFQAHRILPIAADIRTRRHLTYTPAPDIIHEAAGHAPFLSDASYAAYLMKIGEVAGRAFSTPADQAIYEAIFTLSEVKEDPASTEQQVARAEQVLEAAIAAQGAPSEAALIARLYWWTVEYGMVGDLNKPKLFGAGLLSSIGEGYFCEDPAVRKLRLSSACVDVAYDITRPQPQLFVAHDFEQLSEVLEQVANGLSQNRGGLAALEAALRSEQPATLVLDTGEQVVGTVTAVQAHGDARCAVELDRGHVLNLDPQSVVSAYASRDERHARSSRPPSIRVPKPRERDAAQHEMLGMFERAAEAFRSLAGPEAVASVEALVARLDDAYPEEWLVRYELLAGLVALDTAPNSHTLQMKLVQDLERLEIRYAHREPIATGLLHLRSLMGTGKA
jgi:phenylalanine-4-hydroxylase